MSQPEGLDVKDRPHHVFRLRKALYGLKQAPWFWSKVIKEVLLSIVCVQPQADASLYYLRRNEETVHVLVYVDDILLLCKKTSYVDAVASKISNKFEVRIERSVTIFLAIIIERNASDKSIKIHRRTMIYPMLHKFGMNSCKAATTPLPEVVLFSISQRPVDEGEQIVMNRKQYRKLVGCLFQLSNTTRSDIAFSAGCLSRFMQNPVPAHRKAAKYVL